MSKICYAINLNNLLKEFSSGLQRSKKIHTMVRLWTMDCCLDADSHIWSNNIIMTYLHLHLILFLFPSLLLSLHFCSLSATFIFLVSKLLRRVMTHLHLCQRNIFFEMFQSTILIYIYIVLYPILVRFYIYIYYTNVNIAT